MSDTKEAQILQAEERLRIAMLNSDVGVLDELISPELIFTTYQGQVVGKKDDLTIHQSGLLKFTEVATSEQRLQFHADVAIVSVRVHLSGTYGDAAVNGDYRFTRIWAASPTGEWQVIAGHVSAIQ